MAEARDMKGEDRRERLLRVLAAATFLIFFQAYMVAPLIPRLSAVFGVSGQMIGLIVPAYMIPYGVSTLFYGLLSDRLGRRRLMLASFVGFVGLTALSATAQSATQMLLWRLLTGLGASGVVPLALALMGTLFPYEQRGRPLGWLFGAMAGGMAFGSTFGALLEPFVGWRGIFLGVSLLSAGVLGLLLPYQRFLVFTLFTGFGLGSLLFGGALRLGFGPALAIFSAGQLIAAVAAIPLFRKERPQTVRQPLTP